VDSWRERWNLKMRQEDCLLLHFLSEYLVFKALIKMLKHYNTSTLIFPVILLGL